MTGAHEKIRTPNLLIRSQMLYPIELRARSVLQDGADITSCPRVRASHNLPKSAIKVFVNVLKGLRLFRLTWAANSGDLELPEQVRWPCPAGTTGKRHEDQHVLAQNPRPDYHDGRHDDHIDFGSAARLRANRYEKTSFAGHNEPGVAGQPAFTLFFYFV